MVNNIWMLTRRQLTRICSRGADECEQPPPVRTVSTFHYGRALTGCSPLLDLSSVFLPSNFLARYGFWEATSF